MKTGLTDGRYTEVASVVSGELAEGAPVVTGLATLKVPESAQSSGGMGRRGGLGRF